MILLLLSACRTATVVDACPSGAEAGEERDTAYCLACETDADCGYTGNACTETVYCAHDDAPIAVIEIGCDAVLEYAWPDDATCRCTEGTCAADR